MMPGTRRPWALADASQATGRCEVFGLLCPHCTSRKEMFVKDEATRILTIVECAADGFVNSPKAAVRSEEHSGLPQLGGDQRAAGSAFQSPWLGWLS